MFDDRFYEERRRQEERFYQERFQKERRLQEERFQADRKREEDRQQKQDTFNQDRRREEINKELENSRAKTNNFQTFENPNDRPATSLVDLIAKKIVSWANKSSDKTDIDTVDSVQSKVDSFKMDSTSEFEK